MKNFCFGCAAAVLTMVAKWAVFMYIVFWMGRSPWWLLMCIMLPTWMCDFHDPRILKKLKEDGTCTK